MKFRIILSLSSYVSVTAVQVFADIKINKNLQTFLICGEIRAQMKNVRTVVFLKLPLKWQRGGGLLTAFQDELDYVLI